MIIVGQRERDGRFELKQKEGQYRNQRLFSPNLYSAGTNCCIVMEYSGVDLKIKLLSDLSLLSFIIVVNLWCLTWCRKNVLIWRNFLLITKTVEMLLGYWHAPFVFHYTFNCFQNLLLSNSSKRATKRQKQPVFTPKYFPQIVTP